MELSTSNHLLLSNGCVTRTDYSLQRKEERKDILSINDKSNMDLESIDQNTKFELNQLYKDKEVQLDNFDKHTSSGKKRKMSENVVDVENHVTCSKVTKLTEPIDLKHQTKGDTGKDSNDLTKLTADKLKNNRRSLWILACDRCSFETENMDEFASHIDTLHSNLDDFKCHKCTYSTSSSTLLKKHDK